MHRDKKLCREKNEREGEGMKISITDMETMHRMLGIIEGAVYGMGKRESIIYDAIENINSILDKAEVVTGGQKE